MTIYYDPQQFISHFETHLLSPMPRLILSQSGPYIDNKKSYTFFCLIFTQVPVSVKRRRSVSEQQRTKRRIKREKQRFCIIQLQNINHLHNGICGNNWLHLHQGFEAGKVPRPTNLVQFEAYKNLPRIPEKR